MKVGIIIGRFQTPFLHQGYLDILDQMRAENDRVIIFLGVKEKATKKYPLSFRARKFMIHETYPDFTVMDVQNNRCDAKWSQELDTRIERVIEGGDIVTLYGSRDSFIPHYKGKYSTTLIEVKSNISSTVTREAAARLELDSLDYRIGVIAGVSNQYPSVMTTVDVAILNEDKSQVLLGRKPNETKFRFIGGFSSVESESFEQDARREVAEEVGIEVTDPQYIGSFRINDWRQRGEENQITTVFFAAKRMFGRERAGDDIEAIKWFSIDALSKDDIVEEHEILLNALKKQILK